LKKFASQIPGLEMKQFNTCIDAQTYKEFIDNDVNLASIATDVLRQQSDGTWRVIIDNPWGTD
jgi:hypothetical protein